MRNCVKCHDVGTRWGRTPFFLLHFGCKNSTEKPSAPCQVLILVILQITVAHAIRDETIKRKTPPKTNTEKNYLFLLQKLKAPDLFLYPNNSEISSQDRRPFLKLLILSTCSPVIVFFFFGRPS